MVSTSQRGTVTGQFPSRFKNQLNNVTNAFLGPVHMAQWQQNAIEVLQHPIWAETSGRIGKCKIRGNFWPHPFVLEPPF